MGKVNRKTWTLKEDTLIAKAVKEHPERPHVAFKNIAFITGRTIGSVRGRYKRMYVDTGMMPKIRPRRAVKPEKVVPVSSTKKNIPVKEKKLNAIQRFVKRLFNI